MKNISRPQYYRVKRILELIRQGMEHGVLWNCSDFAGELEVSRPTITRDLDFLRSEENAPIEYVPSEHGYMLNDLTWELPAVSLSGRELFSFSIARKLLSSFEGTALKGDMDSMLRKISESLEGKVSFDLGRLTDKFSVISEDYVVQDADIWAGVSDAVDASKSISVRYQKFNGEAGDYQLEPYHLLAYHGNWYVLARNIEKDMVATFAVSRIRSVEPGGCFQIPKDFDVSEYVENSFGIVRGEKKFRVRLLCAQNIAAYIKERVWQKDQKIVEKRNGSIELSFETAGWKELVRWILSWQPDMKVLTPKRLAVRIEEKMKAGISSKAPQLQVADVVKKAVEGGT